MTNDNFDCFLRSAVDELKEKQSLLQAEHRFGSYTRWSFDQTIGLLEMYDADDRKVCEADVIFIGSHAGNANTWRWAWSNETLLPGHREKSAPLKALGDLTGLDLFVSEQAFVIDDEPMAWDLAAIIVKYLNALGVYRAPHGQLNSFLALTGVRRVVA